MKEYLNTATMQGVSYNVTDQEKFDRAISLLKESLFDNGKTLFCSDNVITWNRSYSFLRDAFFLDMLKNDNIKETEKSIIWRTYILSYFSKIAARLSGDFVELGCHTGHTVHQVIKRLDFKSLMKKYYLYDLFEWNEGDEHTLLKAHENPNMHEDVVARFSKYDFVKIIKGSVPKSFEEDFPESISFCHIDMNHHIPEAAALKKVLPRLVEGGIIVFDDYGWWGYSAQKIALDPIASSYGKEILELPTGQGLLINL